VGKAAVWPPSSSPANLGGSDLSSPRRKACQRRPPQRWRLSSSYPAGRRKLTKAHRRRPPLRWRLSSSDLASSRPDLVDVWWRRAVVHRRATEAGQWAVAARPTQTTLAAAAANVGRRRWPLGHCGWCRGGGSNLLQLGAIGSACSGSWGLGEGGAGGVTCNKI
jgi:hypothetical protein